MQRMNEVDASTPAGYVALDDLLAVAHAALGEARWGDALSVLGVVLQSDSEHREARAAHALAIEGLLRDAERADPRADWEGWHRLIATALRADPENPRAIRLRDSVSPDGEQPIATYVNCDIVGSQDLGDRIGKERYALVVDRWHEICSSVVRSLGGIPFFIRGDDGLTARFSDAAAGPDNAGYAVTAAWRILELVRDSETGLTAIADTPDDPVAVRIGIHISEVLDYPGAEASIGGPPVTVGSAPVLASRLQAAAAPGELLVSEATFEFVREDFGGTAVHRKVKHSPPIRAFAISGPLHAAMRELPMDVGGAVMRGRDRESALLDRLWHRAQAGPVQPLLLLGELGIGKSRLVAHLREIAGADGEVIEWRCSALGATGSDAEVLRGGAPRTVQAPAMLQPVAGLLAQRCRIVPADNADVRLAKLRQHFRELSAPAEEPLLAPLLGVGAGPSTFRDRELSPEGRLAATFAALADWLRAEAKQTALACIIEDLHWADSSTLRFIETLVQGDEIPGLFLVLTARPNEFERSEAFAEGLRTLCLSPLDGEAIRALIADERGDAGDPALDELVAGSGGNPLLALELSRAAAARGPQSARTVFEVDSLPLKLRMLYRWRLNRSGGARSLVRAAAVYGQPVPLDVLAEVTPYDRRTLRAEIAWLVDQGILEPVGDAGTTAFGFMHPLLRAVAYASEREPVLRRTHREIAIALDSRQPHLIGTSALIAAHFEAARDYAEAVGHWRTASDDAQARGAHEDATRYLSQLLEVADHLDPEAARKARLFALERRAYSTVARSGYTSDDAKRDYVNAGRFAGTSRERVVYHTGQWQFFAVRGELKESAPIATRLYEAASEVQTDPTERDELLAEAWSVGGYQRFYEGDLRAARASLEEGLRLFERVRSRGRVPGSWGLPQNAWVANESLLGMVCWLEGDQAATQHLDRSISNAAELGFLDSGPYSEAFARIWRSWRAVLSGDGTAVAAEARRIREIADEYGYDFWRLLGELYSALGDSMLGSADRALPRLQFAVEAWEEAASLFLPAFLGHLASARLRADRPDLDRAHDDLSRAIHRSTQERIFLPELYRMRSGVSAQLGEQTSAVADAESSVRVARELGSVYFERRAEEQLAVVCPEVAGRLAFARASRPSQRTRVWQLPRLIARRAQGGR